MMIDRILLIVQHCTNTSDIVDPDLRDLIDESMDSREDKVALSLAVHYVNFKVCTCGERSRTD